MLLCQPILQIVQRRIPKRLQYKEKWKTKKSDRRKRRRKARRRGKSPKGKSLQPQRMRMSNILSRRGQLHCMSNARRLTRFNWKVHKNVKEFRKRLVCTKLYPKAFWPISLKCLRIRKKMRSEHYFPESLKGGMPSCWKSK